MSSRLTFVVVGFVMGMFSKDDESCTDYDERRRCDEEVPEVENGDESEGEEQTSCD